MPRLAPPLTPALATVTFCGRHGSTRGNDRDNLPRVPPRSASTARHPVYNVCQKPFSFSHSSRQPVPAKTSDTCCRPPARGSQVAGSHGPRYGDDPVRVAIFSAPSRRRDENTNTRRPVIANRQFSQEYETKTNYRANYICNFVFVVGRVMALHQLSQLNTRFFFFFLNTI